ncbi:sensor histidine kinase [Frondihabitans australicus]|uniref:histidine kinase n=1 Tax=Frondihabitans australicus TaxID=386892 RepID=A0A495ID47_9MICO|nr:sensor histidine kinase [Frondihabitans australicus]RKR73927.1 signal transduction histidine kinase [Frondihabitans australicus]
MWNEQGFPRRRREGSRWFPPILSIVLQLPALGVHGRGHHPTALALVAFGLGIAAALALIARRRWPGPTVVVVALLAASALALSTGPPVAAIPLAIAVVSATIRGARVWVWSTLAGVAVIVPSVVYAVTRTPVSSIRPLAVALALCFFVGLGEVFRARRERWREVSRQVAERRRAESEAERLRIARELHDVLAHSLSQISVQANVGLHLFDAQPDKAKDSLAAIKLTSGQALEEVRGVLGFLRQEGSVPGEEAASRSPAPDLSRLPSLVAAVGRGGLEVRLDDRLGTDVPHAVQLALYRIVQEALTNAARHANATVVDVGLAREAGACVATIRDDGRGHDPAPVPGRGITGMRERAELLGGTLSAGPAAGGGFEVVARIPVRGSTP